MQTAFPNRERRSVSGVGIGLRNPHVDQLMTGKRPVPWLELLADTPMTEAAFLRAVCEESDCDLLLDVNNLYVNQVNLGLDAGEALGMIPGTSYSGGLHERLGPLAGRRRGGDRRRGTAG